MALILVRNEFEAKATSDPLYQVEHDIRMGAISDGHLAAIERLYPEQAAFARALIPALNFNLNPPMPILASLVILRHQLQAGRHGVMASVAAVRMPLSILSEVNGRLQRYLTPMIALARQSWLTFNMAMKNRVLTQDVCAAYGIQYVTGCCCGLIVTAAGQGDAVLQSAIVQKQDYVRSAADRLGIPVDLVSSLDQVEGVNADLTGDERDTFAQMEILLNEMAKVPSQLQADTIKLAFKELRLLSTGVN